MNGTKRQRRSLTEGSIALSILSFALPIFLGQVLQQFYNMADAWVIGNFASNEAFAAVSSGGNLTFLIIGFFGGIATGGGVVIARYFGARDKDHLQKAIHSNFLFGLLASLTATVFGLLIVPWLLVRMNTPENVLPHSLRYFRIYFGGVSTVVLYNICMATMQALGDSVRPLYYLGISSLTNVALDLLFVAGFHWGVGGAAAATVIAQGLSVVLCILRMTREKDDATRLDLRRLRWHRSIMKQIIRQGLPTGVQNSVIGLGNVVIQTNINTFGAFAMSGHGAYCKIEGFAFLSVTAMSMTLPTFVSQNLGAGQIRRTKQGSVFAVVVGMAAAALTGVLIRFNIVPLLKLFVSTPEAIEFGMIHAGIVTTFYALLAFSHCAAGILRGCGKSTVPMVVMLSFWCVTRSIYVTVILKFIPQFGMISWAYPLTWTLSSIVFALYLLRLDWEKTSIQI